MMTGGLESRSHVQLLEELLQETHQVREQARGLLESLDTLSQRIKYVLEDDPREPDKVTRLILDEVHDDQKVTQVTFEDTVYKAD